MTQSAWTQLVSRFQKKITLAYTEGPQRYVVYAVHVHIIFMTLPFIQHFFIRRFIVSFTGSSVTAGHDSFFSQVRVMFLLLILLLF